MSASFDETLETLKRDIVGIRTGTNDLIDAIANGRKRVCDYCDYRCENVHIKAESAIEEIRQIESDMVREIDAYKHKCLDEMDNAEMIVPPATDEWKENNERIVREATDTVKVFDDMIESLNANKDIERAKV